MIEWTKHPIMLGRLRVLWNEGKSARRCAETINQEFPGAGITKNSVVGAAHRHGFAKRLSPILRQEIIGPPTFLTWTNRRWRLYGPPTYEMWLRKQRNQHKLPSPRKTLPPLKSETIQTTVFRAFQARVSPENPCCWPMGDPGTKGFRYCDAPGIVGKPYCQEHHAVAYMRSLPRGEKKTEPDWWQRKTLGYGR